MDGEVYRTGSDNSYMQVTKEEAQQLGSQEQIPVASRPKFDPYTAKIPAVDDEEDIYGADEGTPTWEEQQDKVELDMLRQKCDAWREEAEKLAPLRGEVGRLHTHASALQEEIKFLKADNEQLGKQLQSVTEERDRIQTETYRKAPPDYDNLRDRLTELQQVCVQLESELIPLREERTVVLMENARLREGAQLRELEKELSEVKDQNAALQSQLQEYVGVISDQSERDKMELDMLKQKCDAWREEAKKLAPLRDEVGHLHTHASVLEEEIKFLKTDNEGLGKQLQSITEERDRIQTETYRKAPPDYDNLRDRVAELQQVRVQLESELIPLREERAVVLMENARLREGAQLKELEKELSEVKDQNAALQSQLQEYVGVISDQSKVIQSGKVHDSEYVRVQQLNIHLGEFLKKQQLEYEEALSSLNKNISHLTKLGDENLKIHQLNVTLTAELEDYRTQTKRLLADLQQKDAKLAEKEAEVDQLRQQGGIYSSDLDVLRQKCDAWREEAEKLAPLRDEIGCLHTHASALEEEIKFLKADNEGLGKQLQSERDRLTELQQVRDLLESELIPLRKERAAILLENHHLRAQPEKYAKLKEDYDVLEGHCKQVQIHLEEKKTLVLQLQQQLTEATSSGSDKLQTVRQRMERYRQERDEAGLEVSALTARAQDHESRMRRYREERNQAQLANENFQDEITMLSQTVQSLKDELQSKNQVASETMQQLSDVRKEIRRLKQQLSDMRRENEGQVQHLQQSLTQTTQQLSDVRREKEEKDAQIHHLQQRLDTTVSRSHSQEIEFWRVSPEEVQLEKEVLGQGAWGCVTRGMFRGQQVAVKKVHSYILKPHTIDRIHREISTMAQVRHPNLVLFIAAVLDNRTGPMIITEILDTNLRTAYEENRLGSNKLRIFQNVASALNYLHLHREPIIHRDVSTANVLLEAVANNVWKAKLSDFGSANLVRFATTPGEGAIIYTAPEAFPQHPDSPTPPPPQTPKIDVYSYGVLVGEVVTQELPDLDKLQEIVQQVQGQWPQIHPLVSACTKYSPDNRPTMAYILDELEKLTP